jgi:MFS family permease
MTRMDALRNGGISRVLAVKNFRYYFAGLMVSVSGTWMQTTAQAWLVLQITDSPLSLAIVASLQFLPIMLLSLVGGAVADRFPRRMLMFWTQLLGATQAILLGTLTITGTVTIWHIYALAITLGIVNALNMPLRLAFVSELVPRELLPVAVALTASAQNLGRIVGPAIAGIAISAFGVGTSFYLNAASFSGILIALLLIDSTKLQRADVKPRGGVLGQIGESLAYARRQPSVLFLLISTAFVGLFGQNFTTMVPLIGIYLLNATPTEFGLLNSCLGLGSLLTALILTSRGGPSASRVLAAGSVFGLALIAISLSSHLWLSCTLFLVLGGAYVTHTTAVNTSMQMQAPPEMRGRFAAMTSFLSAGSSPIGQMLTGAIASGASVWIAIFFNGAMCCVGMVIAYAYLLKSRGMGATFDLSAAAATAPFVSGEPTLAPESEELERSAHTDSLIKRAAS